MFCAQTNTNRLNISIQALYDYKDDYLEIQSKSLTTFQFKHCTIIRMYEPKITIDKHLFQFKHCTIISA